MNLHAPEALAQAIVDGAPAVRCVALVMAPALALVGAALGPHTPGRTAACTLAALLLAAGPVAVWEVLSIRGHLAEPLFWVSVVVYGASETAAALLLVGSAAATRIVAECATDDGFEEPQDIPEGPEQDDVEPVR